MLATLLATGWTRPVIDYHALAPEIILAVGLCALLIIDLFLPERSKWATSSISGLILLATLIPIVTLAVSDSPVRSMINGSYVVDDFSLVLKALFIVTGYVVVLLSSTYLEEGDYYQGEYYFLLLTSVLGMMMMASSRELIAMFVALEFLSIPAYMLAAWRKRDPKSNEAGVKYFLLGVFASAVMLYGMSLLYGITGTTSFSGIALWIRQEGNQPILTLAISFVLLGFGFKVSAVPFHTWAPDTYEGAPTPITAFLSVASKAAGFVALVTLIYAAFPDSKDVWQPMFWVLSALTMTVGNLTALRQTNIVRMLAYSSVAQGGFILMPLSVIGESNEAFSDSLTAVISYLLIYSAMQLGAFAVVLAMGRHTKSGEISSYGGMLSYAPGLTTVMTIFLASLGGLPPFGGFFAKFTVFKSLLAADSAWAVALAVIAAVNSVIALYYYLNVARQMWMNPVPDNATNPLAATTSVNVPSPWVAALAITTVATIVTGVIPNIVLRFGDLSSIIS
jgi:NADH-quinone oxidoreductase subunit N